jgi:NAD(P)-dependent dehydrogenase (short-subunit alcohol dehydrogenase family)
MIQESGKVALVTGSSSGFGLLITIELAKAGFYVYGTMRNLERKQSLIELARKEKVLDRIEILLLDVTQPASIKQAIAYVKENSGRIDVLVNNAGYAQAGFVEEMSEEEWKKQFDTNFFGVLSVTREVIPLMREAGDGRIINMSSISGLMGFPALTPYVSSKFALEGFSESLRYELKPFGIHVILIEPGSYQTNIWTRGKRISRNMDREKDSPYQSLLEKIENYIKASEKKFGDPLEVAKKVVQVATKPRPGFRYPIGKGIHLLLLFKLLFPWRLREKIVLTILNKQKGAS